MLLNRVRRTVRESGFPDFLLYQEIPYMAAGKMFDPIGNLRPSLRMFGLWQMRSVRDAIDDEVVYART